MPRHLHYSPVTSAAMIGYDIACVILFAAILIAWALNELFAEECKMRGGTICVDAYGNLREVDEPVKIEKEN